MTMTRQRGEAAVEQLEQQLGDQVRQVRLARGLTQQQVADLANTSVGALKNLENGRGATTRTLARVLRALGKDDWIGTLDVPRPTFNPLHPPSARTVARRRVRSRAPRSEHP